MNRRNSIADLLTIAASFVSVDAALADDQPAGTPPTTDQHLASQRQLPVTDTTFRQVGRASWYGGPRQGHRTASGERFDQNELTAAHRSLPFNSWVLVTDLQNHRAIVVRINDRGPYVKGRIIDLSLRAAQQLGIKRVGSARVRIESVPLPLSPLERIADVR